MITVDTKSLNIAEKYCTVKLPKAWFAEVYGIDPATYYRWLKSPQDQRKGSPHQGLEQYSSVHEQMVLRYIKCNPDLSTDELIAHCLDLKDEQGRPIGVYLGSRSYVYRLKHKHDLINNKRLGNKGTRHNFNKKRLRATAPRQVFVWDITYIYTSIEGEYYYLYSMMDLFSRKMIHWEVHHKQSDHLAAQFLEHALKRERIAIRGHLQPDDSLYADLTIQEHLILHSDNGAPMKGKNMLFKVNALGITASYSRPHHSNDNAHMESSFALLKHCHSMPIPKCFESTKKAQEWCDAFYDWYNHHHLHSGINFITPADCHAGLGPTIMENRNRIVEESGLRRSHPYSMPKTVSLMSFATKRKLVEKRQKEQEYKLGSAAA